MTIAQGAAASRPAVGHQLVRLLGRHIEADGVVDIVVDRKRNFGVGAVHRGGGCERQVPAAIVPANNQPEELNKIVALLERELGRIAQKELLPMQAGDVPAAYADVDDLAREIDFRPSTSIEDGIARFVAWYRTYHS